jgi:hypothetical protein
MNYMSRQAVLDSNNMLGSRDELETSITLVLLVITY